MATQNRLRIGVIGAGGIARKVHLPSLDEIEGAEVVAICDLIEERAVERAKDFSIPKTYTLYKEMLAKEELDAAYVLVELSNLFHVANSCLAAGLHTFMEKPPGITSFQCESLVRAAEKADRTLQVGFNRRHIPLIRRVVEIMREATTITQVEGRFMKCGSAAFDRGGVSAFVADVIHAIDLVRWIADGEPVAAATVESHNNDDVPNAWNAVAAFDNGVTGVIKSNYQTGGRVHTFEIHGPGASAFINIGFGGRECEARILFAKGKSGYSLSATGAAPLDLQTIDGKELAGGDEFHRFYGFLQEDQHFVDRVQAGKPPETSIQDALKTFRFVDLLSESVI